MNQFDNINSLPVDNTQQTPQEKKLVNTFFNQPQSQNVKHNDILKSEEKSTTPSKQPTIVKKNSSNKQTLLVMVVVIFLLLPEVDLFLMKKLPTRITSNSYTCVLTKGVIGGILFWLLNKILF